MGHMLKGMMARILAGGILACSHIDEEAAGHLLDLLSRAHYAVGTLEDRELSDTWYEFLHRVRDSSHTHPLLSGYTTRLLYDRGDASHQDIERMLRFYSSAGNPPIDTAHWFEGFLRGTGTLLLLNDDLWGPVHQWVCGLHDAQFYELLPIIRRTFSEFTPAERRKLGEKAKGYSTQGGQNNLSQSTEYNATDAARVLPLLQHLLGIG